VTAPAQLDNVLISMWLTRCHIAVSRLWTSYSAQSAQPKSLR